MNENSTLPSSDEENLEDEDTLDNFELRKYFNENYVITHELAMSLQKDYILNMCSNNDFSKVGVGLSNGSVALYDINGLNVLNNFTFDIPISKQNPFNLCGIRFLDDTSNSMLIGTYDGVIRLIDTRTGTDVAKFVDASETKHKKVFSCFDVNSNGRILCAGTEKYENDVYLLFYDIRQREQLGAYFESHNQDVTSVKFHKTFPDLVCSGSTDGLINIFNINETSEDDAILTIINTESTVHKLKWHKNVYNKDVISCITHCFDFLVYECDEGDLMAKFNRGDITDALKRKNSSNCNIIDAHNMSDDGIFLLGGTITKKGDIMRSMRLENKNLEPIADFKGNKQIVRESLYHSESKILLTGGESGILTLWSPSSNSEQIVNVGSTINKMKSKRTIKGNKKTPY